MCLSTVANVIRKETIEHNVWGSNLDKELVFKDYGGYDASFKDVPSFYRKQIGAFGTDDAVWFRVKRGMLK